MEVPKL